MFLGVRQLRSAFFFFALMFRFMVKKNKWIRKENSFYTFRYLTCSTPSMCASISWMTLASLSASSAERRPLLIFSASRLMSLWASSKYAWSGWSSGVCLSRSLSKQHEHKYTSISLQMSSLLLNTGWGHLGDQQSYILRYLNQQFVSRNPLDRFNHQVAQSLFFLVLTHVLLSEWRMGTRQGEKMTQERPEQQDNWLRVHVSVALHVCATRWRSGSTVQTGRKTLWLKTETSTRTLKGFLWWLMTFLIPSSGSAQPTCARIYLWRHTTASKCTTVVYQM